MPTKHTPGPWRWELNLKSKRVQLCGGVPRFDISVMDFVRWGMGGAAPRFVTEFRPNLNLMRRAEEFAAFVPGREHHADWFQTITAPDAVLIAAAPLLLEALKEAWRYATGEEAPWLSIASEDAASEGERFAEVHAAVCEAIKAATQETT